MNSKRSSYLVLPVTRISIYQRHKMALKVPQRFVAKKFSKFSNKLVLRLCVQSMLSLIAFFQFVLSNSILPILHLHKHKIGFDIDFGLTYSIFNNDHNNHQRLFKTHYKNLDEPILVQPMVINFMYPIFVKLKNKWKK